MKFIFPSLCIAIGIASCTPLPSSDSCTGAVVESEGFKDLKIFLQFENYADRTSIYQIPATNGYNVFKNSIAPNDNWCKITINTPDCPDFSKRILCK